MCYNSRQAKEIKRRYKYYTLKQLENIKSNIQDNKTLIKHKAKVFLLFNISFIVSLAIIFILFT